MRHRNKTKKLNKTSSHRRAMLSNMVVSFFAWGKIRTTHAKAKEAQRFAEKMITLAIKGGLHNRRQAVSALHDKSVVKKLFVEIAPVCKARTSGYTRITKLGARKGDGAPISMLEFVEGGIESNAKAKAQTSVKKIVQKEEVKKE